MKRKILRISAIILVFIVLSALFSPRWIIKALIYQYVGIYDHALFKTRTIETADPQPWPISKDYNKVKISQSDLSKFNQYKTVAFVIIQNDSLKHESYFDNHTDTSVSNAFSATKSIVSLLCGIAIDEGKIKSLDQPITDYYPEFSKTRFRLITIRDLLTMSSGLDWDESYGSLFSTTTKAYYGDDIRKMVLKLTVCCPPGKDYRYKSGDTELLAMIIEKATGKHLADYASEKLWKPMGAEDNALWYLDHKDGMEKAYCCFTATARDFARIGQLVLDSGSWKGKQLVSKQYIAEMLTPASYLTDEKHCNVNYYGFQWWMLNFHGEIIPYARGILGQYIFVIPSKNAVVVRLGHERDKEYAGAHPLDVFEYLDVAYKILE